MHRSRARGPRPEQLGDADPRRVVLDAVGEAAAPARQQHRADGGDKQQVGGDSNGARKRVSSSVPIWPGVPKPGL